MPHYDDFGGKLSGSDRVMTSANVLKCGSVGEFAFQKLLVPAYCDYKHVFICCHVMVLFR